MTLLFDVKHEKIKKHSNVMHDDVMRSTIETKISYTQCPNAVDTLHLIALYCIRIVYMTMWPVGKQICWLWHLARLECGRAWCIRNENGVTQKTHLRSYSFVNKVSMTLERPITLKITLV